MGSKSRPVFSFLKTDYTTYQVLTVPGTQLGVWHLLPGLVSLRYYPMLSSVREETSHMLAREGVGTGLASRPEAPCIAAHGRI